MEEQFILPQARSINHMKEKNYNGIQEIKKGLYKNHYLIYTRKSTDEPENQKNSIRYQFSENNRFAQKEKLPIASVDIEGFCIDGVIAEKHSAFKETADLVIGENGLVQYRIDRPKFHRLIQLLNDGCFKGVIILCWDRISRNKGDETIIRKLMKSGVDFKFVLANYDKSSAGALHMDIDGMFAEHHSRVTSEKVKLTIRNQRDRGYFLFKAPVGYLNTGTVENKPIDPVKGPLITTLFELYTTGNWSLESLAKWATENGLTLDARRRRRTPEEREKEEVTDTLVNIDSIERLPTNTAIQKILTNPFYTGKIKNSEGEFIQSKSHIALVSDALFLKVQQELKRKKICIKYLKRLDYPLRGVVRCGCCFRSYTPYVKKGHIYYGCRCNPDCINEVKNIRDNFLIDKVRNSITNLIISDEEGQHFSTKVQTENLSIENERIEKLQKQAGKKKRLKEDLSYLKDNKLTLLKTGVYTPESYVEEETRVQNELIIAKTKEEVTDMSIAQTLRNVLKLSELLKNLTNLYDFGDLYEKERIIKLVFSELTILQNDVMYQCKNGFSVLQNRLVPNCAPNKWLSELSCYSNALKQSITSAELYTKSKEDTINISH